MAVCVYCNKREASSGEHYLPRCMGRFRNFEELYDRVCSDCNEKLGLLDEQFCRCGPEAFFRRIKGIEGRKHHEKINPFYRGSAGGHPITIETQHPTLDCKIFCEIEKGKEQVYPARQIVVRDSNGKYHAILITEKIKDKDDLLSEIQQKDLNGCEFVECWASPGEQEWIETLCKGMNIKISWNETMPYEMTAKQQIVATFTINDNYFRAIAKIGFHYFLKHFSQFTGFEKEFEGIKEFIMKGGNLDQWVKQVPGSFIWGLGHGATTDKYGHLLAVDKNENDIRAKLIFFVGPKVNPSRYYEVYIGKNPERIIYPEGRGHQFVYFDYPDDESYDGRVDPLLLVRKALIL